MSYMDPLGKSSPGRGNRPCEVPKAGCAWRVGKRVMRPTPVFTAGLYPETRKWEPPKWPSVGDWTNGVCSGHAVEYYSVMKRNRILTYAVTWMDHFHHAE